MTLESKFQADFIKDLRDLFPGCIIVKGNSEYLQGIPDVLLLYRNNWAALEMKRSIAEMEKCVRTNNPPNQAWYVETMNHMSFSAFVYPENREEIIHALCDSFGVDG